MTPQLRSLNFTYHAFVGFMTSIVRQLNKCLNFMAFRGLFCIEYSHFFPGIDLNFRHLSSCDTIAKGESTWHMASVQNRGGGGGGGGSRISVVRCGFCLKPLTDLWF